MATTETIKQSIPAGTYAVDPVHSTVAFSVKHAGVSAFRGDFESYEAHLNGGQNPSLEGTVDESSSLVVEPQTEQHVRVLNARQARAL